jgi:tetratricopeptide (TPR) repeat protein
MHVRCPHCHNPIELANEQSLAEISCPSCGSNFSLIEGQSTATTAWAPIRHVGHFDLVEQIGVGAFGSVWKARDTELDRLVAVKIPRKSQLDPNEIEQFLREARAAAQLHHPNIVSVHEVGRDADTVYIVSDLVQGVTLVDWLSGQQPTPRESAQLCLQLAEALEHAHQKGVIHRDIKPGNIMLDADEHVFLMDFGLAKREAGEITMTYEGRVLGTPAYMSPEQARGESHRVDRRTDIYSLGAVLFQLLTGELPFRGTPRMLMHQVLNEEPRSPRALNDRVPRDLETICLKAMAKEPTRRYLTAQELAHDLTCFLSGQPIAARPVGRMERSWRWCGRNPAVAGLATGVLAVLLLGSFVSTYFAIQASVRAAEAESEREKALAAQTLEGLQRERAQEAEKRATEDARQAGIEAEKAQQVARFLTGMFEESAPFQSGGMRFGSSDKARANANLTAREILDRGSERVTAELKDQPVVEAALKDTIGNVYLGIGMIEKAEGLLQEALELRQRHLPREHLDVATSLHSIGVLRLAQARPAEGGTAVREALTIRRKLLSEDHPLVDDSRMLLATILGLYRPDGSRDAVEALELARVTLAWRRKHLGDANAQTALAMVVVAGTLLTVEPSGAEAPNLIRDATPILLKDPATKLMGVAFTEMQKAVVMERLGQRDAAVAAARAAGKAGREGLGDRHPLMTVGRKYAAEVFTDCAKYDELEEVLKESLQFDPSPADAYNSLAWLRASCPDEKHRNGAEAVDYATKACEASDYKNAVWIATLAAAYAEQGNFDEAIRWQTKAMELRPTQRAEERLQQYKSGKPFHENNRFLADSPK